MPTVSLVVDAAITRIDALEQIAAAVGSLRNAGTSSATVPLPHGASAAIDIPKFGEAPPLAIDVSDARGELQARRAAEDLREILVAATGWSVELIA